MKKNEKLFNNVEILMRDCSYFDEVAQIFIACFS